MKSLTLIIFMLLSSVVFSAGITLDIDLDMSIDEIRYADTHPCAGDWEAGWKEIEMEGPLLNDVQCKIIPFSGEAPKSISVNTSFGLDVLYKESSLLNQMTVGLSGGVTFKEYPYTGAAFNQYIYINKAPYVLDDLNNVLWRWGQPTITVTETETTTEVVMVNGVEVEVVTEVEVEVERVDVGADWEWIDVSSEVALPPGQYTGLIDIYGNPILSVEGEGATGMWSAHEDDNQLSEYALEGTEVVTTPFGYMQLIVDPLDSKYKIKWMGTDKALESTDINSGQYVYKKSIAIETGLFSIFNDEDLNDFYYWRDASGWREIEPPEGTVNAFGCYQSYPRAFCVFSDVDKNVVLYELNDGVFIVDAILGATDIVTDLNIYSIVAVGDKRYISTKSQNDSFENNTILMAAPDSLVEIFSITTAGSENDFSMHLDRSGTSMRWVGVVDDAIIIFKLTHYGETEYATAGRALEEEDKVFPRAEIAGGVSFVVLFSMLMLLSVRRPKFRY